MLTNTIIIKKHWSLPSPSWVIPGPCGHSAENSWDPGWGHAWQGVPQPMGWPKITEQQQQADLVVGVVDGFEHWPSLYTA